MSIYRNNHKNKIAYVKLGTRRIDGQLRTCRENSYQLIAFNDFSESVT